MSITYWDSAHETCTARCRTAWLVSPDERRALWERFANAAPPLGYDPSIVPAWQSPDAPGFGALALTPDYLRVLSSGMLIEGGKPEVWQRASAS